jgi:hypothetical protein
MVLCDTHWTITFIHPRINVKQPFHIFNCFQVAMMMGAGMVRIIIRPFKRTNLINKHIKNKIRLPLTARTTASTVPSSLLKRQCFILLYLEYSHMQNNARAIQKKSIYLLAYATEAP